MTIYNSHNGYLLFNQDIIKISFNQRTRSKKRTGFSVHKTFPKTKKLEDKPMQRAQSLALVFTTARDDNLYILAINKFLQAAES